MKKKVVIPQRNVLSECLKTAKFEVTIAVLLSIQICDMIMCCCSSDILLGMLNQWRLKHCAPSEYKATTWATQCQIPVDQNLLQWDRKAPIQHHDILRMLRLSYPYFLTDMGKSYCRSPWNAVHERFTYNTFEHMRILSKLHRKGCALLMSINELTFTHDPWYSVTIGK
jgi:hypothetical protein